MTISKRELQLIRHSSRSVEQSQLYRRAAASNKLLVCVVRFLTVRRGSDMRLLPILSVNRRNCEYPFLARLTLFLQRDGNSGRRYGVQRDMYHLHLDCFIECAVRNSDHP